VKGFSAGRRHHPWTGGKLRRLGATGSRIAGHPAIALNMQPVRVPNNFHASGASHRWHMRQIAGAGQQVVAQ
jgi:hypothetical protein